MQKLQLSIPEPCHENWQNMTPTEQGRFCNSCAKEVIDFSMMTDTEVLNYFTILTNEKVCGRALPAQLDRAITRPKEPKKRLFWYWNYIVMFLLFFAKTNVAKAQGEIKPVTELNPFKPADVNNRQVHIVGDTIINSRVISGKVVDIDSIPVSFATIKIKGTNTGLSADANGAYSIKIKPNDILIISAASFRTVEVAVGSESNLNTIMERAGTWLTGDVEITVGGIGFRDMDYYNTPSKLNYVALLQVRDDNSGLPIDKARIIIAKKYNNYVDTVFTDKKGTYKLKDIKRYEDYLIKIEADGYETNEFSISDRDFNDRKKIWEVLLRKQKIETNKLAVVIKPGIEARVMLGGIRFVKEDKGPIFVVDGIVFTNSKAVNPNDIESTTVLKASDAVVIYGPQGSNGAIIITTKQLKEKTLDTVFISATERTNIKGAMVCTTSVMGSMVKGVSLKSTIADSLNIIDAKINASLNVYPNPVQRGNTINLSLKCKQTGLHQIQITDVNGGTVFYKRINAVTKEQTEMILCDGKWSAGLYYISLFDNRNKLVNKNSFIIQ